ETVAVCTLSAPDAIGRFALIGWQRSLSRSKMSLTRYTTPDSPQKMTKAASARATADGTNNRMPKSNPAKTSRFLVHWLGRNAMRRFRAKGPPDTPLTGVSEAATGEEVLRAI